MYIAGFEWTALLQACLQTADGLGHHLGFFSISGNRENITALIDLDFEGAFEISEVSTERSQQLDNQRVVFDFDIDRGICQAMSQFK